MVCFSASVFPHPSLHSYVSKVVLFCIGSVLLRSMPFQSPISAQFRRPPSSSLRFATRPSPWSTAPRSPLSRPLSPSKSAARRCLLPRNCRESRRWTSRLSTAKRRRRSSSPTNSRVPCFCRLWSTSRSETPPRSSTMSRFLYSFFVIFKAENCYGMASFPLFVATARLGFYHRKGYLMVFTFSKGWFQLVNPLS